MDYISRLSSTDKNIRGIIDRIIWKWKHKQIIEEYSNDVCVLVSSITSKHRHFRSLSFRRKKVNYRILKSNGMMRMNERFIYSITQNIKRNVLTPDKRICCIPKNYIHSSKDYLNNVKRSLRDLRTKSCDLK